MEESNRPARAGSTAGKVVTGQRGGSASSERALAQPRPLENGSGEGTKKNWQATQCAACHCLNGTKIFVARGFSALLG